MTDFHKKLAELIWQAEEVMPYYEECGDWNEFNKIKEQIQEIPYTYALVMAGPEVNKDFIKKLNVDFYSVKGNDFRHFYDYLKSRYGQILQHREICAAACLLENIHQHVKQGVGLCVIHFMLGKYKKISVSDNGAGFFNYDRQKRLAVKDAIKFGKSYGSKYKYEGQALATSFGLWSDLATVETPNDTTIIVPEGNFSKIIKSISEILISLIIAVLIDLSSLVFRNDLSKADIFITALIFIIIMARNKISSFFNKEAEKKYFPEIKFRIKNKQQSGSVVNVYFCNMPDKRKWQKQMITDLKIFLQKRAETFRR